MTDSDTTTKHQPPHDRRSFLKGVAVAGVALPFAVACGSGGGSTNDAAPPPGGGGSPADPTGSPGGGGATVLTPAADVPVGGGVILPQADTVVTQPTKGTFEGFSATCTHMGCTLATVSDGTINCNCHFSKFSIKDGSVVSGPAPKPLPKVSIKADGANIVAA